MTVKIGFISRASGGRQHLHLFELLQVDGTRGRQVIIGWHRFTRSELTVLRDKGIRVRVWGLGVISFAPDVSPALADAVIESVTVRGWVRSRPAAPATTTSSG